MVSTDASTLPSEPCRVCGQPALPVFSLTVLSRRVGYFDCPHCGYLQTQRPDWLDEAYARAINDTDTGIMYRNRLNVGRVIMTLLAYRRLKGRVIDHAGGYGILVRLLRDVGVDAWWADRYCENLVARGFEADEGPADLLTAFEVLEHLVDPVAELRSMLAKAPSVLCSTELVPGTAPPSPDWWYLAPEHGQHIGFFRIKTLRHVAEQVGCHFASDGRSLHLFSLEPVTTSWPWLVRLHAFGPAVARLRLKSRVNGDADVLRRRNPVH